MPPEHTIVIEADIQSTKKSKKRVDNVLRHRIFTSYGSANAKCGNKYVDPALCLYVGAFLICTISNEHLRDTVPRGNGTLCRLVSMKLKANPASHRFRKYYGRKVWTVNAKDVEWIELEHVIKTDSMIEIEKKIARLSKQLTTTTSEVEKTNLQRQIDTKNHQLMNMCRTRRFKLEPKTLTVNVKVKPYHRATNIMEFSCKMTQFQVNLNDATTGHKLQGSSKDHIIITSWPKNGLFKNWEYTVLSRVRSLE